MIENSIALTRKNTLLPLWLTMFCNTFSYTMILPALTFAIYDVHSTLFSPTTPISHRAWIYGLCMALMHVGGIIATPIMGVLADVIGRKKMLALSTLGTLTFPLLTILGLWHNNIDYVLLGSVCTGLFSRADPIAQAIIGDTATHADKFKLMGYLQFYISVGALLGPLLGGFLTHLSVENILADFYLPFIAATLLSLLATLSTLGFLTETLPPTHKLTLWNMQQIKLLLLPLWNKHVVKISLLLICSQITWSFYYQFIPPVLKESFHFPAWQVGIFLSAIACWLAIAAAVGAHVVQRHRTKLHLIKYVGLAMFVGALFNAQALFDHNQLLLWLSAIPIAGSDVLLYSIITALYSDAVPQSSQGTVMALCFIIIAVVWSLTGFVGGALGASSHDLPLIVAPVGAMVMLFF